MNAADYFAVQNQLNRYFQYVDAGELEKCGQLFAQANLIYTQSGQVFSKDPVGVTRQMQSFVRLYGDEQTPRTRHHSGNIIIEFDGDIARTSCSAVIFQGTDTLPFQAIAAASYIDRFKKADGNWIYIERKMSLDFMGDMRQHLLREVSS